MGPFQQAAALTGWWTAAAPSLPAAAPEGSCWALRLAARTAVPLAAAEQGWCWAAACLTAWRPTLWRCLQSTHGSRSRAGLLRSLAAGVQLQRKQVLGAGSATSMKGPTASVPAQHATAAEFNRGLSASGGVGLPTWQLCLQGSPEAADECCAVGRHKAILLEPPVPDGHRWRAVH